jgi:copper chaperone CopZ
MYLSLQILMLTKLIMKTVIYSILLFVLSSLSAQAQSHVTTAHIKVYGNCGMCKARIEKVLDHPGIKKASWNTKTKDLEVVFNHKKISEQAIHELVSSAGHDTDKVKAKDEVYANLPFCCLYRDHDHSGMHDDGPEE